MAVKTFIYEVSAGRPKGVGEASDVAAGVDGLPTRTAGEQQLDHATGVRLAPERALAASASLPRIVEAGAAHRAPNAESLNDPVHRSRRAAWSASFLTHALVVAALTIVSIAQSKPIEEIELRLGPDVLEDQYFSEAEFASESQPEEPVDEAASELLDPGMAALSADPASGAVGSLAESMAGEQRSAGTLTGGLGELGTLFGDSGQGMTEFGSGLGGAPLEPQFFGAKIEGRRIVFVLDNSGSMQGGRLEAVNAELERCIGSLDADQEFYVIFYSDAAYPLFYPTPVDRYVKPTPRNKELLHEWLESVELCLGDAVLDALNAAASIEPDTVILLSDGRIQGERKMAALLAGGGSFPLHTIGIGLGAGAVASRRNLADVAAANGGEFREAEAPEEMKQLAREKPRPYHNKGPGPIWGRSVKAWGGR
jgi:hypothetical protein